MILVLSNKVELLPKGRIDMNTVSDIEQTLTQSELPRIFHP